MDGHAFVVRGMLKKKKRNVEPLARQFPVTLLTVAASGTSVASLQSYSLEMPVPYAEK